jgi:hypothetical protein
MGNRNRGMTQERKSTSIIYCQEKQRLLEAFGATVQELTILHEQQFLAIVDGDSDCNRFDLLIHLANEKKQQAKYAFMSHMETHGC